MMILYRYVKPIFPRLIVRGINEASCASTAKSAICLCRHHSSVKSFLRNLRRSIVVRRGSSGCSNAGTKIPSNMLLRQIAEILEKFQ